MNSKSIITFLLLIMFFGCEDNKNVAITDNAVYSDFFVKYDRATDKTTGTALFWDGTHTKRLIFHSAAKLLFIDNPMDYRSSDYTYVKELMYFLSPATFTITDVNSKTFTNTISINSIELPPQYIDANLDTIDSSQPLPITWYRKDGATGFLTTGTPLEAGETVTLRIETVSAQQEADSSRSVTFTLSDFARLSTMKGKTVLLSIERTKVVDHLLEGLGGGSGTITAQYITVPREVYLK